MRVAFLGNAAWSVPPLEALADSAHRPNLVVTAAPKPSGRGRTLAPTPVAEAGRRLGLPLAEVETVKAGRGFDLIGAAEPDVLAVVAYGEILPPALLEVPARMPVNLHFSLLPELRGAAPVQRALLEGLAVTGVTTIRMDQGMDTGPILLQQDVAVAETDDAGTLGARLAAIGGRLLVDTLGRLEAETLDQHPQDESRATYAPKLTPDDEIIDWGSPADAVVRRIRALAPVPGARTTIRGKVLKVFAARSRGSVGVDGPPGRLSLVPERQPAVRTSDGMVILDQVALEGRRRMSGDEFARGYRLEPDDTLGT
jgi:methionyl-tRNA formyltransferase